MSQAPELALDRRTDYSDACAVNMQRRYHMQQRSPLLFWLLLAATICADAIAINWAYGTNLTRAQAFYFGLICGEISLGGIWASFPKTPRFSRWLAPVLLILAGAFLTAWLHLHSGLSAARACELGATYLGFWTFQLGSVIAGMWFFRQTSIVPMGKSHPPTNRWQFSVKHLLVLMTATAVVFVVLREAKLNHDDWKAFALWGINNSFLALSAVFFLWAVPWHLLLRLSALVAVSAALTLFVELIEPRQFVDAVAINLIQAAVLSLWLELGYIMPQHADAVKPVPAEERTKL